MTIAQKILAAKEWLEFVETYSHRTGDEPTLRDWEASLQINAQEAALEEIGTIAQSLLEDGFTREAGERILAEIHGAGA